MFEEPPQAGGETMRNNLKRNAYVMIDHWSQILTVLISLYKMKKQNWKYQKKNKTKKNNWNENNYL